MLRHVWSLIAWSTICLLAAGTMCLAQTGDQALRFDMRVETRYERTALNYNLLLVDTTSLSADSLEQLHKSADTRTEPSIGLRTMLSHGGWHLDNGVYYSKAGWREQFDGRGRLTVSEVFSMRSRARFEYRQENGEEDSLLSDYWNLGGDVHLLAALSASHTAFVRADADWLQYTDQSPAVGYDYHRLRSRIGWRWQSAGYDFMEMSAGIGRREVPDSSAREYTERFAALYGDFGAGEHHRLSLDLHVNAKDYRSPDPTDDYMLAAVSTRWDYRPRLSWLISARLRWDLWDFRAEDEVNADFYEIEPHLELKIPLGDRWAVRLGPRYRVLCLPDGAVAQAEYRQPSGIFGVEFMPAAPVWTDVRAEIGYRDYEGGIIGYSDFTTVKLDAIGDADIGKGWSCSAAVNYEIEFHAAAEDDTDFLFFSFNLAYRFIR